MSSIGDRVLQILGQVCPGLSRREVAERVGMTPDAFSRAVNGKRQFASIELARLAGLTGSDLHWLVTGEPDPNRLTVAARHDFDSATGLRTVPGRAGDEQVLADIGLAYRQAFPQPESQVGPAPSAEGCPRTAAGVREALGPDFVRHFTSRLEERLGIDVVRVRELSTAYSFIVGGRAVIAVPATASWFYENWSLAHELGHLVRRDHDDGLSEQEAAEHEAAANGFAADLLLPAETLRAIDWDSISDEALALHVWDWGVSTNALCRRLDWLLGQLPARVARWAAGPTQRLLRRHLRIAGDLDAITTRMNEAAQRRFPLSLQEAHLKQVEAGAIGKATLAWMLGVEAAELEVDSPEVPQFDPDDLVSALGL